jgi:hypothetical protein
MVNFTECRHILPNGRKCRAAALRGKPFCFHHTRLHFRSSSTRISEKLANLKVDDLSGLQAAVAQALSALASPLTDIRRAGVLLYGLHLAASLSKRTSPTDSRDNAGSPQ